MNLLEIMRELADFDTPLLANTIGYIDDTPSHEFYLSGDIQSVTPSIGPTVGIAVTCEIDTSTPNNPMELDKYWAQLEQMDAMEEPVVWVLKTVGSRPEHECVLGDGMGKMLTGVGCIGAVTDGRVRDVQGLHTIGLATYCRGTCAHHTAIRIAKVNEPVDIGGITISPGDVIHANHEGVIRVPPACLEILPDQLVAMRAFEHDVHKIWRRNDLSVAEKKQIGVDMFAKHGFDKFRSIEL